ncbi:MAG TPA: hypothetical protein PKL10_11375, partial [Nitrospira sp.]|nr:hypothetical protein [Nitrospira sp.]
RSRCLIQGLLRSPPQSFQIRIFPSRCRRPLGFFGLPLDAASLFLTLFGLFGFFSIAFRDGGLACSCDGVLLLFALR